MILTFTAGPPDDGRTVYSVLRRELRLSQTLTRRLKQTDGIRVGGRLVYTDYRLTPGETVEADLAAAEPPCDIVPENGPLDILYEDDGLIAVNKPAGLLTHPSRARYTGTLANAIAGHLRESSGDARCHAVNRLDRDTSGAVLFAKNSHLKALASQALQAPEAEKTYLALVYGVMDPPLGIQDAPIKRLREGDMLRVPAPDGQKAVTHYDTLSVFTTAGSEVSLLKLSLETGRTHQIRVHCLAAGHPVLGDGLYCTPASLAVSDELGIVTQALHAHRLTFMEPVSGKRLSLMAEPPEVFGRITGHIV